MNIPAMELEIRKKRREAGVALRAITEEMDAAEIKKREREFDALMEEADELEEQVDELREKADRAEAEAQRTGRRPIPADGRVSGIDGMGIPAEVKPFALRSSERMADWAEARTPNEYPGLTLGKYLRCMVTGAKTEIERRALAEGTDSAGGFTVPTVLSAQLIDLLRAASVVNAAGAQTVPLTSDKNNIAALASDPVPAWRVENAAVAESDPTFRNVPMEPKSLAVLTKASFEVMQDSLNMERELPRIMATALAKELDRVALLGSGVAPEPTGIANQPGIGTSALAGVLANYAPLVSARTGILTANAGPVSAMIMHPRDEGTLAGLVDSTGQPLMAPTQLSQIPMLTTTAIPTDGGAGSDESTIFAGNFEHLMIGLRSSIRIELLRERFAENLQYGFLAHMRADIAIQHAGAFYTVTAVQG